MLGDDVGRLARGSKQGMFCRGFLSLDGQRRHGRRYDRYSMHFKVSFSFYFSGCSFLTWVLYYPSGHPSDFTSWRRRFIQSRFASRERKGAIFISTRLRKGTQNPWLLRL